MNSKIRKLIKRWEHKATHAKMQSDDNWLAGMPANRLLGASLAYDICVQELLRTIKP